jgi:maltose alpha-D-glucosyltransferase / alpha-amylase
MTRHERIEGEAATGADWYKDAIIYQLHVKAFRDSNGDGIGDFAGLIEKLDYIQELGATAIWLLPFYPSPLRDDGYDIADYTAVNPSYGSMRDARNFISQAHRRGLKVITELVINHTSDQHPWFQRARHAPRGSAARDFYVWSDDDRKYDGTRIIFLDTEKSNWSWDPVAGQYFWHRFYAHQPDLNFDNPRVLKEVLKVMHFWLKAGVDGLRLDAIPYLVEREGTNNENLPETHAVLKRIRAELDAHYGDRMLLAEANQWPEDTQPYFGEGDECHMGFHFPLMPRMYMAVAQEDRHPITDIIRQTPDIPPSCQWGIFLRNHDELTLEMVTEQERDYLWNTYAEDSRARINLGIRRRLAPLMQNDRRKIELMNSMLLSMPGTPILYYGDEIGMGDNYYLGDRDGVRTPMQWSPDRNAGFSNAMPQQLFLPVILDPVYGYQAINVESQAREQASLLNWTRRMVAVRKQHPAFGRGTMTLLYPRNRKILAYVREYGADRILCVANLSRSAQAAEIDLSRWRGSVPIELTGRSAFPPVGDLPYLVTLPAYGYYWFLLAEEADAPSWHQPVAEVLPEFVTLPTRDGRVATALAGREAEQLCGESLPLFLKRQRWFAGRSANISDVKLRPLAEVSDGRQLTIAEANVDGKAQCYFLPLAPLWGEEYLAFGAPTLSATVARLRTGPRLGALIDAAADPELLRSFLAHMRDGRRVSAQGGTLIFERGKQPPDVPEQAIPRLIGGDQSNLSMAFGDHVVMKVYRRLREGTQPDIEVARFLTEVANYPNTPAYLGSLRYQPAEGDDLLLAAAFQFVGNQGDAWVHVGDDLDRMLEEAELVGEDDLADGSAHSHSIGARIGQRLAELHAALATSTSDPAFASEPVTDRVLSGWVKEAEKDLDRMFAALAAAQQLPAKAQGLASQLVAARSRLQEIVGLVRETDASGRLIRIHGDLHLGQILVCADDVYFIDFEGEPGRSITERRRKMSPLRDVAGMIRSIDYAAGASVRRLEDIGTGAHPSTADRAANWARRTTQAMLEAYRATLAGGDLLPLAEQVDRLLTLFVIQKAAYEVVYEIGQRPDWVDLPLEALLAIAEEQP